MHAKLVERSWSLNTSVGDVHVYFPISDLSKNPRLILK